MLKLALAFFLAFWAVIAGVFAQEPVEQLVPEVLSVRPHDAESWIQGLILHDGFLYESAGQYGQSSLRQVDPETGEVLLFLPLPEQVFAEGLALVDDFFYQITWREQVAFRINLSAFTERATLDVSAVEYEGEGWGLCYDGDYLYMSDGSDMLAVRDPDTFEVVETLQVTYEEVPLSEVIYDGESIIVPETAPSAPSDTGAQETPVPVPAAERVDRINELECVDDSIYANVWQTDFILRIDKTTGAITGQINAAGLLDEEEQVDADVLNGIVYLPESETFLITGKLWPKMFEVVFVPVAEDTVTD
jgi:glutaminyl-peptide cyclotransferase